MVEIALAEPDHGVFQKEIAERQKISVKYLDSIIASLKTSGLIRNSRGRKSGYTITRMPSQIKMFDIYKAFESDLCIVDCIDENYDCQLRSDCRARDFWGGLNSVILEYFKSHTLEDLMKDPNGQKVISNGFPSS
jgi:Rrf2 family protein